MKKLISCLLAALMLFSVASAFAFAETLEFAETENALKRFLDDIDLKTEDIVLVSLEGDQASDLLIHLDGDNLHLVSRNNGVEDGHIQLTPEGIYLGSADSVTLLRYATVTTVSQEINNAVNSMLERAVQSIPQEQRPTKEQIKQAIQQLAILSSAAAAQQQADAATLYSATMAFAGKFKPEYILDVVKSDDGVLINLRSDAFASALADAMDELMTNPALAELVDRRAALNGGQTFADMQKEWLQNREATLEYIRSIKSIETLEEDGHYRSHFQIGEELSALKILICETDAWIDAESGNAQATIALGFKNEDPLMVYEFKLDPYSYWEKLSSGDSTSEVYYTIENNKITSGKMLTVVEGNEQLRASFGPDYLYMKGPKGGVSSSVRETWSGKTRYELVAETAEGAESSFTMDFYEEYDSLVCEMYGENAESSESAMFKISRIDRADVEDLSASKNITEITVDTIKAEIEGILKLIAPKTADAAKSIK